MSRLIMCDGCGTLLRGAWCWVDESGREFKHLCTDCLEEKNAEASGQKDLDSFAAETAEPVQEITVKKTVHPSLKDKPADGSNLQIVLDCMPRGEVVDAKYVRESLPRNVSLSLDGVAKSLVGLAAFYPRHVERVGRGRYIRREESA